MKSAALDLIESDGTMNQDIADRQFSKQTSADEWVVKDFCAVSVFDSSYII